jgi:hypothetical protein
LVFVGDGFAFVFGKSSEGFDVSGGDRVLWAFLVVRFLTLLLYYICADSPVAACFIPPSCSPSHGTVGEVDCMDSTGVPVGWEDYMRNGGFY